MPDSIFSKNYFEIFSLDVSTSPDLIILNENNRELQRLVHPDKFASSGDAEKRLAMQQTSLINQAFNTLKDPVSRLQYMLTLKGVDMSSEADTTMNGVFLMEQMELRETIAGVRSQADPLNVLDKISKELKTASAKLIAEFDEYYQASVLDKSREVVRKLQFINKAQHEVAELFEQLEDELL
jgi:molecular chaperone HscB